MRLPIPPTSSSASPASFLQNAILPRDIKLKHPFMALDSTPRDQTLATAVLGWTFGFSVLTIITAWRQTKRLTVYTTLCWTEVVASFTMGILTWLYMMDFIPHSFSLFFFIVLSWAIQLHCLAQIIVNRICILLYHDKHRIWLKSMVAVVIIILNIGVFVIWVPARLQVSRKFEIMNDWYDRIEKVIMLILDAYLNIFFIRIVKQRLVSVGLTKYDALVRFNTKIIFLSILMDFLIIGFMSYPNTLIYLLFHPVAYLVKLQIEMTMSDLIVRVAKAVDETNTRMYTTVQRDHTSFSTWENSRQHGSAIEFAPMDKTKMSHVETIGSLLRFCEDRAQPTTTQQAIEISVTQTIEESVPTPTESRFQRYDSSGRCSPILEGDPEADLKKSPTFASSESSLPSPTTVKPARVYFTQSGDRP